MQKALTVVVSGRGSKGGPRAGGMAPAEESRLPGGPDDSEEYEAMEGGKEGGNYEDAAGDMLGDILRIPSADLDDFKSSLKDFVKACIHEEMSEPEHDDTMESVGGKPEPNEA